VKVGLLRNRRDPSIVTSPQVSPIGKNHGEGHDVNFRFETSVEQPLVRAQSWDRIGNDCRADGSELRYRALELLGNLFRVDTVVKLYRFPDLHLNLIRARHALARSLDFKQPIQAHGNYRNP
jgi:hypothetical protein